MMRSMELRGGIRQLFGSGVVAVLVVAEDLPPALLRRLLDQVRRAALRALLVDRPVPEHEIAVRIVGAAEEDLAAPRFALDDLAALVRILRAHDAGRLVLDVLALGIAGARGELAEAALLDDQVRAAARALLVENLVRLGRLQATLLGRDEHSGRLALGIPGAREELPEAAAFDGHRLAAVLARLDLFVARLRLGLLFLELARVGALGISAAGDEWSELADALEHRHAAF